MKRDVLFPFAALAAVTACNDDQSESSKILTVTPETNAAGELADQSAPTPQEGPQGEEPVFDGDMTYYFSRGERGPSLSFGTPHTDNIALNLRCPAGSMGKTVLVYFNRPAEIVAPRSRTLTLVSGDVEERLTVETRDTQLGTTIEAQTGPDGPAMKAFRDGNMLEVFYGDETIAIPSRSGDKEIDEFFDACLA